MFISNNMGNSIKMRFSSIFALFIMILFITNVCSEKLEIQIIKTNPENVNFKVTLYGNDNNKMNGEINYIIENYYTDIVKEGKANSGEEINFKMPKNPVQGPWKISANYKDVNVNELFNVGKLEKAEIRLEENNLVIENIGNVPYDRKILIYIGDQHETAQVYLEVGQIKKIRLTGENKVYTIRVNDGSEEKDIVFSGVSLTGNVVGLEKVMEGNLFTRYPLLIIFVVVILAVAIFIATHKVYNKYRNKPKATKRKKRR